MDLRDTIKVLYAAFNRRDIDGVLKYFSDEVSWPNGWEGGYVRGPDEVRDYWTRQWREIDPHVEPVKILNLPDGRIEVDVQQTVKDLSGNLLADSPIKHIYTFENGLVRSMEIVTPE